MKRSLRLPFSLLLVIAALTLLACRSALLRGFGSGSGSSPSLFFPAPENPLNSTLLSLASLASLDSYEPVLKREIDGLLDGDQLLPAAVRTHRSISLFHRRDNPHDVRIRPVTRFQSRFHSPADLPRFRRSLRDWIRGRRFQPQVMSDLLRLVKIGINSSDDLTPYGSCAVVGNSGILLQREHGDLIDSHDLVIRLNNARIQGYARHVGSKTSLSFVNSNILHLCARRQGCPCHPYGSQIPIVMYLCQPLHLLDFAVCGAAHGASSPLLVTDPRFDVLCSRIVKYYSLKRFVEETGKPPEEWGKSHDEKMFHYSSGMQAVMLATGICRRVSVFGFGKSTEAKHHYHTNQKAELDLHDYAAEYAFYRDLVENPQVIPFLSESGFAVPPVVFYH